MNKVDQTAQPADFNAYVTQTLKLLGLSVPPAQVDSVVDHFERVYHIAQPVLEFPLPDSLDPMPKFEP